MKKTNFKKYIFRISLVLALLVSAGLSIYAMQNYKSNNAMTQNMPFNGEFNPNRSDGEDMTPPNGGGRIASDDHNEQQVQNENGQSKGNRNNQQGKDGSHQNDTNNNRPKGENNMPQGKSNNKMNMGTIDTKYLESLNIYSGIILILSFVAYYLFELKKIKIKITDEKLLIVTLLAVGFFLRIAVSNLTNSHNDINLFKNWAETAANGFSQFYANAGQADYPPVYIYILGCIGKIANIQIFNSYYILLLKIPSIIADVATAYFIYRIGKRFLNTVTSTFLATFYIFNPAIFIDSTFWGQVDSLFTLLIVISIYLLYEKKYVFSSVMFALSVLMKPQGIIFLPVLFFELVRQRKIRNFIYAAVSAVATVIVIIIPFSVNEQSPTWIFNLYLKTISEYPYASVNAFNFFGLVGANYKNDNTTFFISSYHTIGIMFIILTTLIGWILYIKGNDRKYISAISLLQIAGVFTFSVGMHERYLFPAVALSILAFIYSKDRRFFIMAIGFSITSYINISTVFFKTNTSVFEVLLKVTSLFNVILVLYLVKVIIDNTVKKFSLKIDNKESELL